MNSIKVAFCTNGIFPNTVGGMQRHSRLLIDELGTYPDIEITVFHPHEETIFQQPNIYEVRITGMDSSKNYLLERYRYSKRIYKHLQDLPDHIIYSQGPSVWHKASEFTPRLIINPHGLEPFQGISLKERAIGFPFRLILKRLFKKARYVVSLGGKLTDILKPIVKSEDHISILPNAVSETTLTREQLSIRTSNEPLRALFVGRFASNKGIHILMETITQLNEEGFGDEIEFYLAGKGPLYESYNASNTHPNVHILGFVSDEELENLYKESDIFVLPTLFEGMPTVVLEAMSHALPIVVTDVGATGELVGAQNGFLIEKNNAAQLKNTLIDFIKLPDSEKLAMGEESLLKVEKHFTWSKVTEVHYELFKTLHRELPDSGVS